MKAAVYIEYGPPEVVRIADVPKPAPKDDELLIRVHATTVTSAGWRARSMTLPAGFGVLGHLIFGVTRPRQPILGRELSGVVEAVGSAVRDYRPEDEVFASTGARGGCHAEYVCVRETDAVALKPAGLTHEEAASLSFGGTTALEFLRWGGVKAGEQVLVNGASGCVGTAAVQLARELGAEVTGVCSTPNVEVVRSLGAVYVVDHTQEDFTTRGQSYDAIVDTVGTAPYARSKKALANGGRLLAVLGGIGDMLRAPWIALTSRHRIVAGPAGGTADDLRYLAELAEPGKFRPVIDRRYPLDEIVDAYRHVDQGHKVGNVVITMPE